MRVLSIGLAMSNKPFKALARCRIVKSMAIKDSRYLSGLGPKAAMDGVWREVWSHIFITGRREGNRKQDNFFDWLHQHSPPVSISHLHSSIYRVVFSFAEFLRSLYVGAGDSASKVMSEEQKYFIGPLILFGQLRCACVQCGVSSARLESLLQWGKSCARRETVELYPCK